MSWSNFETWNLSKRRHDLRQEEKREKLTELIPSFNMDIYIPPCIISTCERMRVYFFHPSFIASLYSTFISYFILACVMHTIGIFLFFKKKRTVVSMRHTLYSFCGANWRPRCNVRKGNCELSLFECRAEITCRSCPANERAHWLSKRGKYNSAFILIKMLHCRGIYSLYLSY